MLAVYRELSQGELDQAAAAFNLGQVRSAHGIPQGTINTNYRMETSTGRYFLRHTAVRSAEDLAFEAGLLAHLHDSQFPAPTLLRTSGNAPFIELAGGRVSLFRWLTGEELGRAHVRTVHCERLGRALGRFHRLGRSFTGVRANPYGPPVVRSWLGALSAESDAQVVRVLPKLRAALEAALVDAAPLPTGPIHADLFLDNVKWDADRVSALFDFEMACVGPLALDLAVTLNAWCFDGVYAPELCRALVAGYREARPLEPGEGDGLYRQAVFGAVRFTLSRIRDLHLSPLPAERLARKDFRTYEARVDALVTLGAEGFRDLVRLDAA